MAIGTKRQAAAPGHGCLPFPSIDDLRLRSLGLDNLGHDADKLSRSLAMSEMKTFVFTDIVQSVTLKGMMQGQSDAQRDQSYVSTILTPHRERIEKGLAAAGGRVVSTAGDGHFLVFANTISAAEWAVSVQKAHIEDSIKTPSGAEVQVRMGLHVGFPQADPSDPSNFIGRVVDYAARLSDYASGEQILISPAALGLLRDAGLDGVSFHSHGQRELRGICDAEVFELLYDDSAPRETRDAPAKPANRSWTILPPGRPLTQYGSGEAVASANGPSISIGSDFDSRDDETQLQPIASLAATPERESEPLFQRLGNYEIGELVGEGGMGNVYKARHTQFERQRAVKVIKPQFLAAGRMSGASHRDVVRRFYQEIKAVGALDHPNIVVAIDSSAPDDKTHYLVMEYLDGLGADEVLAIHGPLPVGMACEIARQAAVGLDYIHRQGMVHRDMKPSNLMLSLVEPAFSDPAIGQGPTPKTVVVKILDLGLALLMKDDQPRLTQLDHGAMGTAMYMSPEQWNTTSVDIRADIYSLGCTLYHLLVGQPPFYDSDLKPQRAHERSPVPAPHRNGVPKPLSNILLKMMAKSPEARYATPGEVAEALSDFSDGNGLVEVVQECQSPTKIKRSEHDQYDTLGGSAPRKETLLRPPGSGEGSWRPAPQSNPLWKWLLLPLALVVAVGGGIWLSQLSELANSRYEQAVESRRETLTNAAGFAADALATEIDSRLLVLENARRDERLVGWLEAINRQASEAPDSTDRTVWEDVQNWIRDKQSQSQYESNSWFITDKQGRQIAREPYSETVGEMFWSRDYFHGQGRNYSKEDIEEFRDTPPLPISSSHQSAVYSSRSTGDLKVAFSTPIFNGKAGAMKEVIGVIGMSLGLGEFKVLDSMERLRKPLEVLVVDLRKDAFPGGDQRGLLLHHRELENYQSLKKPPRLTAEMTQSIREAITQGRSSEDFAAWMIQGYKDPLGRNRPDYWGAFDPVRIKNRQSRLDADWLIIVQEPMPQL